MAALDADFLGFLLTFFFDFLAAFLSFCLCADFLVCVRLAFWSLVSAAQVSGPTTPVVGMPCARW